jgi:hypothetical protein
MRSYILPAREFLQECRFITGLLIVVQFFKNSFSFVRPLCSCRGLLSSQLRLRIHFNQSKREQHGLQRVG